MKTKILKWLGIEEIKEDLKKVNKEIFPKKKEGLFGYYSVFDWSWGCNETLIERIEIFEKRNQKLEEYLGVEFIDETKEIKKYKKLKVKKK